MHQSPVPYGTGVALFRIGTRQANVLILAVPDFRVHAVAENLVFLNDVISVSAKEQPMMKFASLAGRVEGKPSSGPVVDRNALHIAAMTLECEAETGSIPDHLDTPDSLVESLQA